MPRLRVGHDTHGWAFIWATGSSSTASPRPPHAQPAASAIDLAQNRMKITPRAGHRHATGKPAACPSAHQGDTDGPPVVLAGVDEIVDGDLEVVHVGVAQEADHRLADWLVGVSPQLETEGALRHRVENEDDLDIEEIGRRAKAGADV